MAVGGHSYGAFMTANLLAHSDIFRTGIARSGAYNRTLTPFGFQAEQRTYWEAVDTYTQMSPFTHVRKINEPILLIHGEADDNSGTFPVSRSASTRAARQRRHVALRRPAGRGARLPRPRVGRPHLVGNDQLARPPPQERPARAPRPPPLRQPPRRGAGSALGRLPAACR
jgi:hypothetical protein